MPPPHEPRGGAAPDACRVAARATPRSRDPIRCVDPTYTPRAHACTCSATNAPPRQSRDMYRRAPRSPTARPHHALSLVSPSSRYHAQHLSSLSVHVSAPRALVYPLQLGARGGLPIPKGTLQRRTPPPPPPTPWHHSDCPRPPLPPPALPRLRPAAERRARRARSLPLSHQPIVASTPSPSWCYWASLRTARAAPSCRSRRSWPPRAPRAPPRAPPWGGAGGRPSAVGRRPACG